MTAVMVIPFLSDFFSHNSIRKKPSYYYWFPIITKSKHANERNNQLTTRKEDPYNIIIC